MYLLYPPRQAQIEQFVKEQATLSWSYQQVGATHLEVQQIPRYLPRGFVVDHNRVKLGTGAAIFAKAKANLTRWRMFAMPWLDVFPASQPPAERQALAILAKGPGIWSLNAARIVYLFETTGAVERFGFAYGTLPDHAAQGEERFSVEWHHVDDSVWYDLLAFSRPNQRLARWGYPYVRGLQRRFAADSLRAMRFATG